MSRIGTRSAYSHRIVRIAPDEFRLEWVVDRKVSGSRLRYPTSFSRYTDLAGARRFAKRHDLEEPTP